MESDEISYLREGRDKRLISILGDHRIVKEGSKAGRRRLKERGHELEALYLWCLFIMFIVVIICICGAKVII